MPRRLLLGVLACLVLGYGCGDPIVHADATGPDKSELGALSEPQQEGVKRVALAAALRELKPTWVKPAPAATPRLAASFESSGYSYLRLVTDPARNLFLFSISSRGELTLARLNDAAEVIDRVRVAAPTTATTDEPPLMFKNYAALWQPDSEPTVKLDWTPCLNDTTCAALNTEKLVFSSDVHGAFARFPLDTQQRDVLRDGSGNYVELSGGETVVVKKLAGAERTLVWKRDDLGLYNFNFVTGVSLSGDRIALNVMNSQLNVHQIQILHADGTLQVAGPLQIFSGYDSLTLIAAAGQPALVGSNDESKLFVWRLRENREQVSGVELAFRDAAALHVVAVAADPSGNIYVASRGASTLDLCRISIDNRAHCVSLPEAFDALMDDELRLDELVARDRGVLFARSGQHLLRLDFPR